MEWRGGGREGQDGAVVVVVAVVAMWLWWAARERAEEPGLSFCVDALAITCWKGASNQNSPDLYVSQSATIKNQREFQLQLKALSG